ncbi:hypothetical protein LEMLEM_LOCUS20015, partial [Lemmus lemmus]
MDLLELMERLVPRNSIPRILLTQDSLGISQRNCGKYPEMMVY